MDANQIKNAVLAALASVGSLVANQLGGWDAALQALVGFMAADYITGLIVAGVFKRSGKSEGGALDSRAGFKGIVKKCAVLVLVWMGAIMDGVIGADYIRTAVALFFIANEALSVIENIGLMGVPYPPFLKSALEAIKDKNSNATPQ
jgi:toxin secretion/phage lysis holin